MTPEEIKASLANAAAKEQRRQLREHERQRQRDEERQRRDQETQRERDDERQRQTQQRQTQQRQRQGDEERRRLPRTSNGHQQPQPVFAQPQLNMDQRRQQHHGQNHPPILGPVGRSQYSVEPAGREAERQQIPREGQRHAHPPPQPAPIPHGDAPAKAVPTVTAADSIERAAPALTPEDTADVEIIPAWAEEAWPAVVEALKPPAKFTGFVAKATWNFVKDVLWNILKPVRWLFVQLVSWMVGLLVVSAVIGYLFVSVSGFVSQTAGASMQFLPAWVRNVLGQQVTGTGTTAVAAVTAATTAAWDVPTVMALFPKAPNVGRGVEYLSDATVGGAEMDAWRESSAAERLLGGVLDSGGGAFGSPEKWNEQLQLLQEDVVSTVDKDQKRGEQMALAISQEIRAASNLVAEMDDAENVPNISTAQSWLGKCADAGRDLLSSGSQSEAAAVAAAATQVEKWAQRFGNILGSASATRRNILHAATQEVNQAADGVSQYACGLRGVFDAAIDLGDKAMEYSQRQQVKPKWWHLRYWFGSDKDGGAGRDVDAVKLKSLAVVGGGGGGGDGNGDRDVGYLGEGIQQLRMYQAASSNVCRDAYSTREGTGAAMAGLEEEQRELRQRGDVVEAIRQRAAAIVVSARGKKNVDSAALLKAGDVVRLKKELRQEVVRFSDAIWARCSGGDDDDDGDEV